MARIRLKTKLVLAITGMVFAVVAVVSGIYIAQLVRQRVNQAYASGEFVAHQVFHATRMAMEADYSNTRIDPNNAEAMQEALEELLQTDPGLNSLLQSILGYSFTIYDVAVANDAGRAMLHTDPTMLGAELPQRELFTVVRDGNLRQQLEVLYGQPRVYEIVVPLQREDKPFGAIRVGVSTVFLRSELEPLLRTSMIFTGIALLVTLVLAASLSNLALRPLGAIARRLDQMSAAVGQPVPADKSESTDEVGAVTRRIDRIGQQMRDATEVFSALKENVDQIMATLQDGLVLFTRELRIVLVSASAEMFIGKPRGEMLGREASEVFSSSTRLGRAVLAAFAARLPIDAREISTENGHNIAISLDYIEERGQRIGALLTLRDAESVRKIEDEIELSRRLAAIGRLTSGVAHEVKNPINAIVVHLELLRQKMEASEPSTRRHMDVIASEIQRLDRVVQTLVDFSRPVELKLTETGLAGLAEELIMLAEPDAARHGVTIAAQLSPDPLTVRIDRDLITQALLNVVLNGVQAMNHGGTLSITTTREGDSALVEVLDQGPGIPVAVRDKIFNLYFTTKQNGTGIGLAMTYRVMQLHNGSVDFQTGDSGTRFLLRLPLAQPQRHDAQEMAAQHE